MSGDKVEIVARFRDTRDGHEADYFHPTEWLSEGWDRDEETIQETLGGLWYYFTEGNFGCDCNRSNALYPDDAEKELGCNTNGNVIELVSLRLGEREVDLTEHIP